jgi:WD40 repeat protein
MSQLSEPEARALPDAESEVEAPARGELVVVVVEEFDNYPRLVHAHAGVREAEQALKRGGFHLYTPVLRGSVKATTARELIRDWQPNGRPLLLYWTGHGLRLANGELLLACTDTPADPGEDTDEVLRARQLGALLARKRLAQTVVLLDACSSGGGMNDVIKGFVEQRQSQSAPDGATPELSVIVSASKDEAAKEGVFAGALAQLFQLDELPPRLPAKILAFLQRDSALNPNQLAGALQAVLTRDSVHWQTIGHEMDGYWLRPVFRNPHYNPDLPAMPVGELGRDAEPPRIDRHFLKKFRGIEALTDRGWYFSGRRSTLIEINRWLASARPGIFTLTGPPGCGKSAVLGRLAVLSDEPTRREAEAAGALDGGSPEALVRVSALDAGLHVRDRSFVECVQELARTLGFDAENEQQLFHELRIRAAIKGRPLVLMLDALDEAKTEHVLEIARTLVRGLADTGGAKVIVGTRSGAVGTGHQAGGRASQLDTVLDLLSHGRGNRVWRLDRDESQKNREQDIEDYITRRLLGTLGSPYTDLPDEAREAGRFLAPRCAGMFLPALIFSRRLADQDEPAELSDRNLAELSAGDLDRAFAKDLARFGSEEPWVRTMLRPLAWAEGNGLPPALWHRLAGALRPAGEARSAGIAGPPPSLPADSVTRALDRAGAYLIEDGEDGQLVYRLYAEQFGEFLRRGQDPVETQALIAESLTESVQRGPLRDWADAGPYLLRHLSAHAAAGRQLADLVDDPRYLIYADPDRLSAVLGGIDLRTHPTARLYGRVEHRFRSLSPADRAEALQEAASQDEPELLERLSDQLDTVWHGLGSTAEPTAFHRVLRRGHSQPVTLVGFCAVPERPLLVSSDGTTVNVWDPADSRRLRLLPWLRVDAGHAALGAFRDGTPFLATAEPGGVRLTDLLSGRLVRTLAVAGNQLPVIACGTVAGRVVIAASGANGVELVDPEPEPGAGPQPGPAALPPPRGGPVLGLALASVGDRDVLAVAGPDRIVLRNARTGDAISEITVGPALWTMALALDENERILLAVGGARGVIEYWQENSKVFTRLEGHEQTIRSLAFVPGVPGGALLSGAEDGVCRLWYLAEDSHRVLQRRANKVLAVAALHTPDGRTVLATGSANCDVRVWPTVPPPSDASTAPSEVVRSVALGGAPGETLLALGTAAGTVQVRSADGSLQRQWTLPHGRVASLACAPGRGAAGFPRGALAFFDPGRDGPPLMVERAHDGCVEALAFAPTRDLLISGGAEGLVKFWRDGRETAGALRAGTGDVRSLSVLESADGVLLACATRRRVSVYRLGERQPQHDERVADGAPGPTACLLGTFGDVPVLITADAAGRVRMSGLADRTVLQTFSGHAGAVRGLGFGRVGEHAVLVTAGDDRSVCLWDPHSGACLDRWTARALQLEAAAFRFDEGCLTRALAMEGAVHLALVRRLPIAPPSSAGTVSAPVVN